MFQALLVCSVKRIVSSVLVCLLVCGQSLGYAQSVFVASLPEPGAMVLTSDAFVPVLVKGLVVHPDKPLNFDFIVDSGNDSADQAVVKEQSQRMAQYFLAAITVPEEQLWVNLSPYEKDRVIENELGQTVLGRDMLAQDYILKQVTSSLIYPEKGLGKEFWARVYAEAQAKFGTTDIPVDTFNKVWIMPDKAEVFEKGNAVYVTEAKLKVMLDSDRTAMTQNASDAVTDERAVVAKVVMSEIVLPAIEKEVNEGKNFAVIRQVYHAAILAKWYRELIQNTLLDQAYVGKNKVAGVTSDEKALKEEIYQRYIAAYKKGVFNYVKEEATTSGETLPRKYFSGGENLHIDALARTGTQAKANRLTGKAFQIDLEMTAPKDVSSKSGRNNAPKIQKFDANLVNKTLSTGRISLAEIQDKNLKAFLQFLNEHGIDDLVVVGGAVRDVFFGNGINDIDIGVKVKMTDEERRLAKTVGAQATKLMYERGRAALNQLAQALNIPVERFFDKDLPQFNGIKLDYLGPYLFPPKEGQREVITQGLIADVQTHEVYSSYTAPGLLQIAIDSHGIMYGYRQSLQDALNGQVRLQGDLENGRNLSIRAIVKWLRLKHEFGLSLSPEDYLLAKKVIEQGKSRAVSPNGTALDHKAMQELIDLAGDQQAVLNDYNQLGLIEATKFHPQGDLAIGTVAAIKKAHQDAAMLSWAKAVKIAIWVRTGNVENIGILLNDKDPKVRRAAQQALEKLLERADAPVTSDEYNRISDILHKAGEPSGGMRYVYIPRVTEEYWVEGTPAGWHYETIRDEHVTNVGGGSAWQLTYEVVVEDPATEGHYATRIIKEAHWEKVSRDAAMLPITQQEQNNLGGIDIQNIDVAHKNGSARIQFNDQAVRNALKNGFNGFTPVIINITPVQSPLMILGVSQTEALGAQT